MAARKIYSVSLGKHISQILAFVIKLLERFNNPIEYAFSHCKSKLKEHPRDLCGTVIYHINASLSHPNSHLIQLSLFRSIYNMPNSTFPAVISFADKKNSTPVITAKFGDENDEDFGVRMANAVEVQEVDTNLYMSKELWLPAGARGAFGGQVSTHAHIEPLIGVSN